MLLPLFLTGLFAGTLGALLGIGGGIVLVPVLHLGLGLPVASAVAVSLACVIATSSGAAASFVRDHLCDVRLGMRLELATVAGAIAAAFFAPYLPKELVRILFGVAILPAARGLLVRRPTPPPAAATGEPRRLAFGMGASFLAGSLSGVLGIGGGFIKVPVMNLVMGVPMRVATATSNFMIGVTAAASAFVYLSRGQLDLAAAAPAVLGILVGAPLGARLLPHVPSAVLRRVFGVVLAVLAAQMIAAGFGLHFPGVVR